MKQTRWRRGVVVAVVGICAAAIVLLSPTDNSIHAQNPTPAKKVPATIPTPTPTPTPACAFPRISINNGALFTNSPNVTLGNCAPRVTEMMLSNDGGFSGAVWEPYATSKAWTIAAYGQSRPQSARGQHQRR